jgi:hypothetical protein
MEGREREVVGEKRKRKEREEDFFPFYGHVFFLLNSQTPITRNTTTHTHHTHGLYRSRRKEMRISLPEENAAPREESVTHLLENPQQNRNKPCRSNGPHGCAHSRGSAHLLREGEPKRES